MGDLGEFSFKYKLFLKTYQWRRIDPVPWTPLTKPIDACKVALVSSAGFVTPDQPRFDDAKRGGDTSFREIPATVDVSTLVESHRSEIFDRLRELCTTGRIGAVNERHLSLMGSITAPGRLIKRTAPQAVQGLVDDAVDIAILVPV